MKAKILAAGFVAALICALKYPHRLSRGYLWAEDGLIFIKEAVSQGAGALWTPYAGYLHAVPRLIVGGWALVASPEQFPHAFAWTCIATYFVIGATLFALSRRHFPDGARGDAGAFAIAWLPFVVPQSPEIYITVTNLQWLLAPVLAFLLLDLSGGIDSAGRRVGSFILAATGPFGVMLAPAVVTSLVVQRNRRVLPLVPYFVACALQVWVYVSVPSASPKASFDGYPWLTDYARAMLYEIFWPHAHVIQGLAPVLATVAILGLVIVACLNGWAVMRVAVPLFAAATVLWGVGVVRQASPADPIHWSGFGARYLFLPELCMSIALVWAIRSGNRAAGKACAVLLLIGMAIKTPIHPSVDGDRTTVTREGHDLRIDFPPASTLTIQAR